MTTQFKIRPLFTVCIFSLLTLFAISCGDDDITNTDDDGEVTTDDDGAEEPTNKDSGFVFIGSTASDTALVKYIEELPEDGGTLDLSDGEDFPRFFPLSTYNGAMFMARPDEGAGFSKYVVNSEGILTLEGNIPTVAANSFRIAVKDGLTGVFHDRNTPDIISVFNPETLEVTANIDMSAGFVPGNVTKRYQTFQFRGDDVFAPILAEDNTVFPSYIVHQASLTTNSFVGDTQRDGDGVSTINSLNQYGQQFTDSQGIFYSPDTGNYEAMNIGARINRILPGTNEFDPSYTFDPALILNPANIFLPIASDFTIIEGQTAIALVNTETPQAAIDIVVTAGGIQNLTPAQLQEIFGILFTSPTARYCILDLAAETVTPIANIPAVSAFPAGNILRDNNGDVLIPVINTSENGYYRWNPTTGTATKAFDIIGGSDAFAINIGNNN